MLNEAKGINDGAACYVEESIVHSWTSGASSEEVADADGDAGGRMDNCEAPGGTAENEDSDEVTLGVLILDGDEGGGDDGEDEEEDSKRGKASAPLSIPETVFLPSEIRTVTVASGGTHPELNKNEAEENRDGDGIGIASRENRGAFRSSSVGAFKTMRLGTAILLIAALLLPLASWRSHVWKDEALRLREEVRMQRSMLPLVLSLLKERESLLEKLKKLEEEIEFRDGPGRTDHSDSFLPGESEEDAILSFKTCYVEGSLSLGHCSREWQEWWSDAAHGGSVGNTEEETEEEDGSQGDWFADDMSKLVKRFANDLASTTMQSISSVERSLKDWSCAGIKDTLSKYPYLQSMVKYTPGMASNNTGG